MRNLGNCLLLSNEMSILRGGSDAGGGGGCGDRDGGGGRGRRGSGGGDVHFSSLRTNDHLGRVLKGKRKKRIRIDKNT